MGHRVAQEDGGRNEAEGKERLVWAPALFWEIEQGPLLGIALTGVF